MLVGKGRSEIYGKVLNWFQDKKRGTILDIPAGTGYLARELKNLGYKLVCGEINPEIFQPKEIECIPMDMTKLIPFPDNYFDYVCCIEGIEHTTDPYKAVSEISRVLKAGGFAIFTVPNYSNIEKRLKYLFTGYLTKPKVATDFYKAGNLYDFHNSPLTITLLDFIFQINNLKIVSLFKDKTKKKQLVFYPLVLLLDLINFFTSEKKRKLRRTDLTLNREVVLGGNTLIIITQKLS
ncbi:MAG: class I SAM-dependent methyltransferase [Deltaproteobacteria bacterium]|nr:class I SAM-dependent methyltransferase [Deltaproteobacteria bacterium]